MGAGTAAVIYNAMLREGLKPHQAAGFLGNFMEESTLNPNAYNKNEGAMGLAQWRGPRAEALKTFATQQGASAFDPAIQARFAVQEMRTNPEYRRSWDLMQNAANAKDAAHAVMTWEKPGGYNGKTNDPTGVPSYNDRVGHATSLLAQLSGAPSPGGNAGQGPTVANAAALPAATAPVAPAPVAPPPAAIRSGGGLVGMLGSDTGMTMDKMKTFMGGSEMGAATKGIGMLASAMAPPPAPPPPPPMAAPEENRPDMSLLALIGKKKKGLV